MLIERTVQCHAVALEQQVLQRVHASYSCTQRSMLTYHKSTQTLQPLHSHYDNIFIVIVSYLTNHPRHK